MINNILIKNASIYHTETSTFSSPKDIQVTDGKITRIEENIKAEKNWELVEGEKLCISSGWTDCHTHLSGFDPFLTYPSLGCTRINDAGSFGAKNYFIFLDVFS